MFHKLKFGAELWIPARLKVALDVWVNSKIDSGFFFFLIFILEGGRKVNVDLLKASPSQSYRF